MAKNAVGLTVEEVLCAYDCPTGYANQIESRSEGNDKWFRDYNASLSLFSFFTADDGNGSHGKRQNISTKNRTLGLR